MKHTNFGPTPRSMSEATFMDAGCAIERPLPARRTNGWKVATWGLLMALGVILLALAGQA
ncbi:MAG TPA: hypothetical protein VFM98_03435 [Ramlibacter sp.]|uniref:hypothetical protein n=1 Tax=Ramlibacter sp. TaxID=1917967 RepID=UPI002D807641|nr:hypothetical protein [Ramlibacter sp.]HET8744632.1 hypothetical protein [Ramlibacter sp.]